MEETRPIRRRNAAFATFAGSTATTLVASAQALLLMPLYLSHIGPRLYGAWLASGDLLVFMLAFDMGIPNLIIQRVGAALAQNDRRAIGAYFGTGAVALLTFAVLLGAGLFSISPFIAGWMRIQGPQAITLRGAFLLDSGAICLMLVNYVFQGLARGLQETTAVNASAFAGTLIGFCVTLAMLLHGHGVWSIAVGLAVRSGVALTGSIGFLLFGIDREIRRSIRIDREVAKEYWRISPPMFISGLGYTLMNDSQVLLAATVLGPESAAVFALTRKAADMAGSILDAIGQASYGGFAHLFATGDLPKSRSIYREIIAVYLGIGITSMAAYLAVNPSLVGVWAAPKMFGGALLTALLAAATLTTGWAYLNLNLYRSTNHHKAASAALLIECLCRVPLMYALLRWLGLPGLAIGAISTSVISGIWSTTRILRLLPGIPDAENRAVRIWGSRAAVLSLGLFLCCSGVRPSWLFVLIAGSSVAVIGGLTFLGIDPLLGRLRSLLGGKLAGVRS